MELHQRSVLINVHLWKLSSHTDMRQLLEQLAHQWSPKDHEVEGDQQTTITHQEQIVGKIIYYDPCAPLWEVMVGEDDELSCIYRGTDENVAATLYRCLPIRAYLLQNGTIIKEKETPLLTTSHFKERKRV